MYKHRHETTVDPFKAAFGPLACHDIGYGYPSKEVTKRWDNFKFYHQLGHNHLSIVQVTNTAHRVVHSIQTRTVWCLGNCYWTTTIVQMNVLIDTSCMQTNVLSERSRTYYDKMVVQFLKQMLLWYVALEESKLLLLTLMVTLPVNEPPSQNRHVWLRAIVCRDVKSDLIIGLPYIQFYDIMPIPNTHLATKIVVRFAPYQRTGINDRRSSGQPWHSATPVRTGVTGRRHCYVGA